MNRKDFWLTSAILAGAGLAVMVIGWLLTPHGHFFTGLNSLAPSDKFVYYSYLEQVRQGKTFFVDLFTGEHQTGNIFFPLWLLIGWLGRLLHTPPPVTYHLARLLAIPVLLGAIAATIRTFVRRPQTRRLAYYLAVLAGGIGFIVGSFEQLLLPGGVSEKIWPMDLWVSEGYTYLSSWHSPHFIIGTALMLFFIVGLVRTLEQGLGRWVASGGGAALILFFTTPFLIPVLAVISLGAAILARTVSGSLWRSLARVAVLWLVALPSLLYVLLFQLFDPLAKGRAAENILLTTNWPITLASYGLLLPLAVWGGCLLFRDRSWRTRLLLVWLITQPFLFYFPVFFQRRLTQGWIIPLAIAAAVGLESVVVFLNKKQLGPLRLPLAIFGAVLLFGSPLHTVANDLSLFQTMRSSDYSIIYLPRDWLDGYQWLKNNTGDQAVVLADTAYGITIPAYSGRHVYVGHGVETIDFARKKKVMTRVFDNQVAPGELSDLARQEGLTHVWVTRVEKRNGFDPAGYPELQLRFSNPEVAIYEIAPAG